MTDVENEQESLTRIFTKKNHSGELTGLALNKGDEATSDHGIASEMWVKMFAVSFAVRGCEVEFLVSSLSQLQATSFECHTNFQILTSAR